MSSSFRTVFGVFLCKGLAIAALLSASGCYRISYRFGPEISEEKAGASRPVVSTEIWNPYFFVGLLPVQKEYTRQDFCRSDKLLLVESSLEPLNVLGTVLSATLAPSTTLEVSCVRP